MGSKTPPTLYTPDGDPVELHVITEAGDCDYVGVVDQGVLGFDDPDGRHVTVTLLEGDDSDGRSTAEKLAYGEGGDR